MIHKMPKFTKKILEKVTLLFLGILFIATWPFLLIFAWVKSTFSKDTADSIKVSITKEMFSIFGLVLFLLLFYFFVEKIDFLISPTITAVGHWISTHWFLFVLLFIFFYILEHYQKK